ncbi:DNA-directed RNA polymerase II subunit 4 [Melia azedarach]|uniref:DNA-directed RNA polymerase II subunit 4 n=1 Tax=Melia azedarach TaxID=155640 RepID=A0ACC1WYL7_MELAZ|nr:DNA-directed RNA polymerase II subunit 4 [Melia azedarach]
MEKGGKPGKGSLKSTPKSLGGKDDNSMKPKRGRKVQFNTEGTFNFSSKSDGKTESLFNKGGLSKGGKGNKVANAAKASIVKESLPLELRIEPELPKNTKCLMDCEAAHILEGIQEQMVLLSADPTIKIPLSFDRGLLYAKTGSHYTNPQAVRGLLETLSKLGVTNGEICQIANVCPETVEEVFALVPSLKAKSSTLSDPLKDVLSELAKFKKSR